MLALNNCFYFGCVLPMVKLPNQLKLTIHRDCIDSSVDNTQSKRYYHYSLTGDREICVCLTEFGNDETFIRERKQRGTISCFTYYLLTGLPNGPHVLDIKTFSNVLVLLFLLLYEFKFGYFICF